MSNRESKTNIFKHGLQSYKVNQMFCVSPLSRSVSTTALLRQKPTHFYLKGTQQTSSHRLAVEMGRFNETPRTQRICKFCNSNDIEDEFHFLFACDTYCELRKLYIKKYYYQRPSVFKLVQLPSTTNVKELCILGVFITKSNGMFIRSEKFQWANHEVHYAECCFRLYPLYPHVNTISHNNYNCTSIVYVALVLLYLHITPH